MKKKFLFALFFMFSVLLVACGGNESAQSDQGDAGGEQRTSGRNK